MAKKFDPVTEFFKLSIGHLPRVKMTRLAGWLAQPERPHFFRKKTTEWFAKKFEIDLNEAEKPFHEYQSVSELFQRQLKMGSRPLQPGVVHPVDGRCVVGGLIRSQEVVQAKGFTYQLNDLLGLQNSNQEYLGGQIFTYYLSPRDYHHIHFPVDCEVLQIQKFGHDLWPVNPWSLSKHAEIFVKNERVVLGCRSHEFRFEIVLVGAVVVGQIELAATQGGHYKKGDRLGHFKMGSTVILVLPKGFCGESIVQGVAQVKMGQTLALLKGE